MAVNCHGERNYNIGFFKGKDYTIRVGSRHSCEYQNWVEMKDNDKHSSLLQYGSNYGRKKSFEVHAPQRSTL
jgi:hypothetical protein